MSQGHDQHPEDNPQARYHVEIIPPPSFILAPMGRRILVYPVRFFP